MSQLADFIREIDIDKMQNRLIHIRLKLAITKTQDVRDCVSKRMATVDRRRANSVHGAYLDSREFKARSC